MLSNTRSLLVAIALCELVAGVLLLVTPSWTAELLLGAALGSPESVLVGRIAGASLLSIGLICWLGRNHRSNGQAIGLITGLLVYNAAAVVLLLYAAVDRMNGIGIWPAIGLHAALVMWCAGCLRRRSGATGEATPS